ncbi:MAG: penicillin-binding protein 2 [Deltaproteobacteria bacterium]|nr:penicillin-binding protein 2 [Deltaproteobacteria bacterium]
MSGFVSEKDPQELRDRLYLTLAVIGVAFFILIARLWYLQVIQASHFDELSLNNRVRLTRVDAPRGLIFDRNGVMLAENRPGFDLFIVPEDVTDWDTTKDYITESTDISVEEIDKKLDKAKGRAPFRPVKIREDLSWEEMVKLAAHEFELPGVTIEVGPKRKYAHSDITAHALGYLGEINNRDFKRLKESTTSPYRLGDIIGKYGIEASFEGMLRGTDGGREVEVNARGRVIDIINDIAPYPGNTLHLTIDMPTQIAAFEAMKDKRGAIIAIEPSNGKVIAMVSAPSFDPNIITTGLTHEAWANIIENPGKVLTNRAIQGLYPPASTFKPLTAAAGLEEGSITTSTKIPSPGSFTFARQIYRDWNAGGHGNINVHTAIVESSDTFFYQLGLKLGVNSIAKYAKEFGLDKKTGIELWGEKSGIIPSVDWKKRERNDRWYDGETILASIGQGYTLTTPLQMLHAYTAIANGGKLYTPTLVERIEYSGGGTIMDFRAKEQKPPNVSEETMVELKKALRGVVIEDKGTARGLYSKDIEISGKTGTAQVVRMKKRIKDITKIPYKLRDHAWFVGFAPYDDPKIAVVVIVEHGGFGSVAAAPLAMEVMKSYLHAPTRESYLIKTGLKEDPLEEKMPATDTKNIIGPTRVIREAAL